ncbi:protein Mis18-alpha isoform X2 [Dasypus novemcinctus]|uniref:protein Mis18-alpha isoform X2 n=1 Tax=Dasypus novemcinctus TaxID=9361 RepID=UPI0003288A3F|nr:protein Mis18-alpha isoform X2 [Dasypus novemcinctus]
MAGVSSLRSCNACSSTSCACADKSKWSDSSLLGKRLSEDSSRHLLLQKWAGMWSSVSGDSRAEETRREVAEADEAEVEAERPLVFLCSGCRRPLGDSLSWVTSQEDTNCILLRCVSCNVSVDKEQKLSKRKNENGCYVLGSSEKQIISEDKELFNLESRVEIEKSLKQMEDVLKALQMKLWEVESKLSPSSCKS